MKLINKIIKCNKKEFPVRIHEGDSPQYIFVTHHGMISNKTSWRYFEKYVGEKAIVVNYDARNNGDNKLKASRMMGTYTRDLRDIVRWSKQAYPNIKIVTLGSSWGASVVIHHAKKYGNEVFKSIAWSVPYAWWRKDNDEKVIHKIHTNENKITLVKETTRFKYALKLSLMFFLNINTKSYTKIDLTKISNNKALQRMNKIAKPQTTPVKLFYSSGKAIFTSNYNLILINKKAKNNEFLYFQSIQDFYFVEKKLKQLQTNSSNGLNLVVLNEGKHAFQWETDNSLNERIFAMMFNWLKTFN